MIQDNMYNSDSLNAFFSIDSVKFSKFIHCILDSVKHVTFNSGRSIYFIINILDICSPFVSYIYVCTT